MEGKARGGWQRGGIPLQVIDGETGFLGDDVEECAQQALYLLRNPEKSRETGARAREHVQENFPATRHLRDYPQLFHDLS